MSKSVPATPDYVGAAQATAQSSADTTNSQTFANRPDQNTPWSQNTWSTTPTWDPVSGTYVNKWTENTNLVPKAQTALDSQLDVANNLSGTAKKLTGQADSTLTAPLDWDKFQTLASTPGSSNSYANNAADAAFKQYTNRNQPLQDRATDQLDTQLQNSGLKPGDKAYDDAMLDLRNQQSDANTNASLSATQFGVTGGAAMQGEDLAAGNFQDQTRQQQISEDLQKRGFTTNEISALLTGNQVQTGPSAQFNPSGAAQPTNYTTAAQNAYEANLNGTNAQNAQTSNTWGTVAGLAATYF